MTDRKFTGQPKDEAAGLYWYASDNFPTTKGRSVEERLFGNVVATPELRAELD